MWVLVSILLWALCAILVLLVILLITPMRFRLHIANTTQFAYRLDVRAIGGLVPQITLAQGPRPRPARKPKKKVKRKGGTAGRQFFRGSAGLALPRLLIDLLRQIHLCELTIDADYGLNDPAETGRLSGLLMPLQYACPLPSTVSLNLRPDFNQRCLKGTLTAGIQVTVVAFAVPMIRFVWSAYGPAR